MARPGAGGVSWGTAVLLAIVVAGLVATGAVLLTWRPRPTALQPAATAGGTVQVQTQEFDDARQVDLAVTSEPAGKVLATASGIVTASSCRPGGSITSGRRFAVIGNRPVLALATARPLWRPIVAGQTGSDVRGLIAELRRTGLMNPPSSTILGWRDIRDLIQLLKLPAGTTLIPPGALGWLSEPSSTIASCEATVGASVSAGTPIATLAPRVTRIALKVPPSDATPGARNLTVAGVTVSAAKGEVTEPAAVAKIASTDLYAVHVQTQGQVPLRATYVLARPLRVASVPASALVTHGGGACVQADGAPVAVNLVGSSLGRTLVQFRGDPPAAVDLAPPDTATCA